MRDEPSFAWFGKVLALRLLLCEVIALLLVFPCFGLAQPMPLLGLLGLLIIVYFVCLACRRGRIKLWSDPGCSMLLLVLPMTLLVGAVSTLAHRAGLSPEWLDETAWGLFGVLGLLAPAIYHWNILEQCYYQVPVARRLRRELGFASDTNTLEGTWPTGRKYLYFQHIDPGGLMDQAGFRSKDIVVDPRGFTEFWYQLEQARGREPITITVVSWSDPGPVSQRPRRQVMIRVPPNPQE
jgi:hypothetical protein